MASANHIAFLEQFEITSENFRKILFNESDGLPVPDNFLITTGQGVTKTYALPSRSIEHLLVGTCLGCTLSATLQISPDGINWCDCPTVEGGPCTIDCDPDVGPCTTKIIGVPLLQYVRLKIGPAGSESEPGNTKICSIRLHFTKD